MTEHQKKIERKVRDAVHQRKTDEADIVVRDSEGHFLFEVYSGAGAEVTVKGSHRD